MKIFMMLCVLLRLQIYKTWNNALVLSFMSKKIALACLFISNHAEETFFEVSLTIFFSAQHK